MGFAGAYVAQAADPSAIFYNAAGIGFLKGKQLYVGGAFVGLSTDFTGSGPNPPAGTIEQSSHGPGPAALDLLLAAGGRQDGRRPRREPAVRHTARSGTTPTSSAAATSASPARSTRGRSTPRSPSSSPTASRSAAGVDIRLSNFKLSRRLSADPNPFPVPTDVAELTLDSGTDTGVGFNVGVLAMPTENLSVGLSYRHEVTIDHGAQANFVQILTGNTVLDQAVAIALPGSQPATVSFTYPASFAAGVALRRGYWTVEADFQWMMWSSFDAVTISYLNSPAFDTTLPRGLAEHLARGDRRRVPDQGRLGGARPATATTTARRRRRRSRRSSTTPTATPSARAAAGSTRTCGSTSTCATCCSRRARRSASAATATTAATSPAACRSARRSGTEF